MDTLNEEIPTEVLLSGDRVKQLGVEMTNSSIPSVITDTSRRDHAAPRCAIYNWCELDHRDPDIDAGLHEKHLTIVCEDVDEDFLLEVTPSGDPRITCSGLDAGEIWIEPGETTNTFRNISAVLEAAATVYDRFVEEVTPRLRRHTDVTIALANRDV